MISLFQEIRTLRQEGKLHQKLLSRVRMLFFISLALLGAVAFQIIFRGASLWVSLLLAVSGFLPGLFFFSRMSAMSWNEDESIVQIEKMDKIGFGVLLLYIVFEVGLRTLLKDYFPLSATNFILAAIFGTLFGRAIGTLMEIHKVYYNFHSSSR
ncbi:MAG: hypothetical protein WAV46_01105 [Candidatus Moraniibacteriota bacterium]